jgi:hypothetical protein
MCGQSWTTLKVNTENTPCIVIAEPLPRMLQQMDKIGPTGHSSINEGVFTKKIIWGQWSSYNPTWFIGP